METEEYSDSDETPSIMSIEEVKMKVEEYRIRGLEAEMQSEALKDESDEIERLQEAMRRRREEMLMRRAELLKLRDLMIRKGLEIQRWLEDLLSSDDLDGLEGWAGSRRRLSALGEGDEGLFLLDGEDGEGGGRRGLPGEQGEAGGPEGKGSRRMGPDGKWITDGEGAGDGSEDGLDEMDAEEAERRRRKALGLGSDEEEEEDEEGLDWSQKRTKAFLKSLMQELKTMILEETEKMVQGLVEMINEGAEEIVREHGEEDRDWKAFGEAYHRVMVRHAMEMGEAYQRRVLQRCYMRAIEYLELTDDLSAEFRRIAAEEYDILAEEFKNIIATESARLLEGKFSTTSIADSFTLRTDVGRRTLALIKPDAYVHADEIIYKIQRYGFYIVQERRIRLTPEQASLFYGEHLTKAFSRRLIEHMSSGPIVALCLASAHCPSTIDAWREVMGPTDVAEAIEIFPNTLRAKYGDPNNQVRNAFHGSHSLKDAEREIHYFFPNIILDPLPKIGDMSSILDEESQKVLQKGLVTLCKEKPSNTLHWFAHWLKHNVPDGASKSTDWKPSIHFDDGK